MNFGMRLKMKTGLLAAAALVVAIASVIFVPLALIWAINILVPVLIIPYTLETWAAATLLIMIFRSKVTVGGTK